MRSGDATRVPGNARRLGNPTRQDTAQAIPDSRRRRLLIEWAWGVVQVVIVAAGFFGGLLAAAFVAVDLLSSWNVNALAIIGFCAGAAAALGVNHSARNWLLRLRLHRLRVRGVAGEAEVVRLDRIYTPNPRGGPGITRYALSVRWQDPATGTSWRGERRYRFWGDDSTHLESTCQHGTTVTVYYPQGRPSRFIVDIPFAPTMADFFL